MMLACWDSYLDFFKRCKQWKHTGPILAVILCLAAAAATIHLYSERGTSYQPLSKRVLNFIFVESAESAGVRNQPAIFISQTNQVTYHPIQGYGEYFFPLWQMRILPNDSPKSTHPELTTARHHYR